MAELKRSPEALKQIAFDLRKDMEDMLGPIVSPIRGHDAAKNAIALKATELHTRPLLESYIVAHAADLTALGLEGSKAGLYQFLSYQGGAQPLLHAAERVLDPIVLPSWLPW